MNAMTAAAMYRRKEFTGINDKYARRHVFRPGTYALDEALAGEFPYDPTGQLYLEHQRDTILHRLQRYAEGHRFYEGEHFDIPFYEGEKKTVFNYTRPIVDKAVDWHNADGWTVVCREGNEQVAELLNAIWEHNHRDRLTQRATQFSAITGDSFFYVTVRTTDKNGVRLPRKQWTVRIQVLNPANVFPVWSDTENGREMLSCMIQFPVAPSDGTNQTALFTLYITRETIYTFSNDELVDTIDNPIGEVNVVHIPNFELAGSDYGSSDIEHIIPINMEYNLVANSTRQIIKYHAEPTTVIYGAKASTLEKGVNRVWSNLPETAKIENLELKSDLNANFAYMEKLQTLICELSSTPKIAFDSFDVKVVSSSAAALELMFQPLVEKTNRRRVPHAEGIACVNRLALLFQEQVIGDDITILADDQTTLYDSTVEYSSPLPRDEAVALDLGIKRVNAGVWSQAELIRQLSGVKNYQRLIIELIADKRAALAMGYEQQRALMAERPNSLVAFLGSETLSEDLEDLQVQIAKLEKMAGPNPNVPPPPKPPAPVVVSAPTVKPVAKKPLASKAK